MPFAALDVAPTYKFISWSWETILRFKKSPKEPEGNLWNAEKL